MRVDLFDFDLPPERIALRPGEPARQRAAAGASPAARLDDRARHATCRACCARATCWCSTTPASSRPSSKACAARRGSARPCTSAKGLRGWRAFVRNAKRLRDGDRIDFGQGVSRDRRRDKAPDGSILLAFEGDEPVELLLERAGRMPLPPYIAGKRPTDARDRERLSDHVRAREGRGRRADRRACTSRPS